MEEVAEEVEVETFLAIVANLPKSMTGEGEGARREVASEAPMTEMALGVVVAGGGGGFVVGKTFLSSSGPAAGELIIFRRTRFDSSSRSGRPADLLSCLILSMSRLVG